MRIHNSDKVTVLKLQHIMVSGCYNMKNCIKRSFQSKLELQETRKYHPENIRLGLNPVPLAKDQRIPFLTRDGRVSEYAHTPLLTDTEVCCLELASLSGSSSTLGYTQVPTGL